MVVPDLCMSLSIKTTAKILHANGLRGQIPFSVNFSGVCIQTSLIYYHDQYGLVWFKTGVVKVKKEQSFFLSPCELNRTVFIM